MCRTHPFRHLVLDDVFPGATIRQAAASWPADSNAWVTYNSVLEQKRALNDWRALPQTLAGLLFDLATLPVVEWFDLSEPVLADGSLWGAGLHEMGPGSHLDLHLDSTHHPKFGWQRRANGILFLSEWAPEWGGELELWQPSESRPAVSILPVLGRLVLFESSDISLHRVAPVRCPADRLRQSLAVFWWGSPEGKSKRPRAQFLALPGENDPVKDAVRRQRAA